MNTVEKKVASVNFEQLNDSKFDAMNLQEIETILGGQYARRHQKGLCATAYSNGKNSSDDED